MKKRDAVKERVEARIIGKAQVGGQYTLYNQDGVPVTDATYHGRYALLYFGFTFCPDICPNEINKLMDVINALEKGKCESVTPVFISIDPSRDTIGQLKYYSKDFDPRISWLTGTTEQIAAATSAFRVFVGKVDESDVEDEEYLVDHSSFIYLIDPNGSCIDFYGKSQDTKDVVASVRKHMNEQSSQQK